MVSGQIVRLNSQAMLCRIEPEHFYRDFQAETCRSHDQEIGGEFDSDSHRTFESGPLISNLIEQFIEDWPAKYFDTAGDRKIAGLVLAYMLENAAIDAGDVSERGYRLLKLSVEADPAEFKQNMPRAFDHLQRKNLVVPRAVDPKRR